MTNIDSGSKRLDNFDITDNKNHTSAQTQVLDGYVGLPHKPALISRRYLKRQRRILSAYKNGQNRRTKQHQRKQKLADFSKEQPSQNYERELSAKAAEPTGTDSVKKNVSTYKIRFQHQDCEQLEKDTKETKTSDTSIHDVALSRESSAGIRGIDAEEGHYSPEATVSLPRLPEMQGSGVITKTLSGKLIRCLPGSKSSNWILVGSDGNHHLRQPTPVPPCFDPAFKEMNRHGTLPPIQDSLTKMLDWGLKTNKLTFSALMQVDHKQACFRTDEIFDFGRELLLETQRAAAEKQDGVEPTNCQQETEKQTVEDISSLEQINTIKARNGQEKGEVKRSKEQNCTNVDELKEEGNEEEELSQEESEENDGDDIEHCRTPTVIVTPTTPKSKAQRHQPDLLTTQPEPEVQSKKIQYKDQLAPKGKRQKQPILPSISRSTLPEGAGTTEPISKRVSSERVLPQIQRSASPTKAFKVHRVSRTTLCSQSPILPRIPSRKTQDKSARNNIRPKQKRKQIVKSTVDDNDDDGCRSETAMSGDSTSGKEDREDTGYEENDTGIDLDFDDKPAHNRSESQIRQRLLDRMEFECQNDAMNLFDDDKTLQRAVELRNLAMHPQLVSPPPSTPCQDRQLGADDFGPEFGTCDNQQPGAGNFYINESYPSESSSHKSLMEQLRPSLYELEHLIDKNFSQLSNKLDDELSQCASEISDCPKAVRSVRLVEVPAPKSKNPERSISDPTPHKDNKGPEIKSVRFAELPPKQKPIERSKSESTAPSDEWNDCFLVAIGKNRAIKKEIQHNQARVPKSGSFNGVDGKSDFNDDDQFDAELIEREMKRYLHWLRHDRAVEQHRWFSANNVSHRHLPMTTHQVPQPLFAVNNQLTESSISAKVARAIGMYSVLPKPDFEGPPAGAMKTSGVVRFPKVPVLPPIAGSNEMLFSKTFVGEIKGLPVVSSSKHKRRKQESNRCACKKGS